jgi:hypothetical protein
MRAHAAKALSGAVAAALVVLLARSIAYAIAPSPASRVLEHRAGGPALPVLALVALALGGSVAIAICWLAAFGVRERALLERRVLVVATPRFRPARMVALALGLSVVTSVGGGLLEAYLHWRAGLGWHGVQCVFGPVHRDLVPIAASLSFIAAALLAAAEHVSAWMRRTFALLRAMPLQFFWRTAPACLVVEAPRVLRRVGNSRSRAPPAFS